MVLFISVTILFDRLIVDIVFVIGDHQRYVTIMMLRQSYGLINLNIISYVYIVGMQSKRKYNKIYIQGNIRANHIQSHQRLHNMYTCFLYSF